MKTPNEFRIFQSGWNKTTKGEFLFDKDAAASVMGEYAKHGVQIMIDLEHLSTDQESQSFDPDARGWCDLQMRGGDLWAVNVKWNPDGERRLTERRQRYISPAFSINAKTRRIESLYNVAICAIPATYDAPALVAASKRIADASKKSGKKLFTLAIEADNMDSLKKFAAALGLGEDASEEDLLKAIAALREDEGGEMLKKLREKLGLSEDAKLDDYLKKMKTAEEKPEEKPEEEKPEATADDMDEHLSKLPPVIQAKVRVEMANAERLRKDVAAIKAKQESDEVESLIRANTDKIPLSQEKFFRTLKADDIRKFLENASAIPRVPSKEPKREDDVTVMLTAEDLQIAENTGTPKEKILAHKKKLAEKERDRREAARG